MYMRIIVTSDDRPDVLLHKDVDEKGNIICQLKAIGFAEGTEGYILTENIIFENDETCIDFIRDYSEFSANKWCKENDIKYSENS